jgi:glucose/arabinose dehydrogenase
MGTGDGGGEGDPQRNAQNLNSLLGKLLRLDVNGATAGAPYAIPPDNPFAGQLGRRGEIWTFGLRNPWRYTFDGPQLYIADVGAQRREEVDISAAATSGLNFGWNTMEGTLCFNAATCSSAGLVLPALEYDRGGGACAIVGGYVYRGAALPELAGRYFYSDFCAGFLKSFAASDMGVGEQTDWAVANVGAIVSFGRDADGELYLIGANGTIYKIVRG